MPITTYQINAESQMQEFAVNLAAKIKPTCLIFLDGELGAGKTTFVRYFTAAFSISTPVSSPTFTLQNIYQDSNCFIEHWDVYRLKEPTPELFEPLNEKCVRIIEWASRFQDLLPEPDLAIALSLGDSEHQRFASVKTK